MNLVLGDKFYKFEEEKLILIRLVKAKNEKKFTCINEETKEKKSITLDELVNDYTRLIPDGHIAFNIVKLDEKMRDVIVTLFRRKDLDDKVTTPYCVCRQSIYDLFTNTTQRDRIEFVGVSVSKDTIPEDVKYESTLVCNGVEKTISISYYIGDTLEMILSMLNQTPFDSVLNNMYTKLKNVSVRGYCNTLKELLTSNDFMYDVLCGYNIHRVPFKVEIEENGELNDQERIFLEETLKVEMFETGVIKYNQEVDLDQIQKDYVLVTDFNDDVYVIGYDKGEYINRTFKDKIKDKRDVIALLKHKKINK